MNESNDSLEISTINKNYEQNRNNLIKDSFDTKKLSDNSVLVQIQNHEPKIPKNKRKQIAKQNTIENHEIFDKIKVIDVLKRYEVKSIKSCDSNDE